MLLAPAELKLVPSRKRLHSRGVINSPRGSGSYLSLLPFIPKRFFAVIPFSSKDLKCYGINLLMVMDGHLDNPGLCFKGTFMSAEHHSTGKEPSTPTEKCVFLSRCRETR